MNPEANRTVRTIAILAALTLVTACTTAPRAPDTRPVQVPRAEQADVAGRYTEAASLWEEAARASEDPPRQEYLLRAAEAWWLAADASSAMAALSRIDNRKLAEASLAAYALLHSELALAETDAERAEFYLGIARDSLAPDQRPRYRDLRAKIDRLRASPGGYALTTTRNALKDMQTFDISQGVSLLQSLENAPSGALHEAAGDPGLDGWPELALLMRNALIGGTSMTEAASQWAARHPDHAVSRGGFMDLAEAYRDSFSMPARIAVLLPGQGGLAAAGAAIRDGLISAYLSNPQAASLHFFPTGANPQSAVSAYFQAVQAGADWIIGPLRRESVQALTGLGGLSMPVLALNNLGEAGSSNAYNLVFSLSLSQEAEARAIARKLLEQHQTRVITLAPDSPWGERIESAFAQAFEEAEGEIIASASFPGGQSDHSALLMETLEIDQSHERRNRLQATIGLPLGFEPTRRDDFDAFFLIAEPEQGRQIRPQLRFHDAGDKHVYAMSRIYSGAHDPAQDRDLDGVVFPHIHDVSNGDPELPDFESVKGGSLGNLFALGSDAWDIVAWLPLMKKDPDLVFPGRVGNLKLASGGQLLRDPNWSVFANGSPRPASWAEPTD